MAIPRIVAVVLLAAAASAAAAECSGYDWSLSVQAGRYLNSNTGRYVEPEDRFMGKAYKHMFLDVEVNVRITDREACSPKRLRLDVVVPDEAETGTCRPVTPLPIDLSLGKEGPQDPGRRTVLIEVKTGFRTGNCTLEFVLADGRREARHVVVPVVLAPHDCAKEPDVERIGQARADDRVAVQRPELLGRCGPGQKAENGVCCAEGEVCCLDDAQCAPFGRCVSLGGGGGGPLALFHAPARCDRNAGACVFPPPSEWSRCGAGQACDESEGGCVPVEAHGGLALVDSTLRPLWYNRYPAGAPIPLSVALVNASHHLVGRATVVVRFEGENRMLEPGPDGRHAAELPSAGAEGEYLIVAARSGEASARHVTYVSGAGPLDLELRAAPLGGGAFAVSLRALDGGGREVQDAGFSLFLDGAPAALSEDGALRVGEGSFHVLRVCARREHLVPALACAEGEYCCRAVVLAPSGTLAVSVDGALTAPPGGTARARVLLSNPGAADVDASLSAVAPPGLEGLAAVHPALVAVPAGGSASAELAVSVPASTPCREMPLSVRADTGGAASGAPASLLVACDPRQVAGSLAALGSALDEAERSQDATEEAMLSLAVARMAYLQAGVEAALGRPDRAAALEATARRHLAYARSEALGAPSSANLLVAMLLAATLVGAAAVVRSSG